MKQYFALAAVLVIASCDRQAEAAPAVDTTAGLTPVPPDSMTSLPADSTMVRDTASE